MSIGEVRFCLVSLASNFLMKPPLTALEGVHSHRGSSPCRGVRRHAHLHVRERLLGIGALWGDRRGKYLDFLSACDRLLVLILLPFAAPSCSFILEREEGYEGGVGGLEAWGLIERLNVHGIF